jgi:hypothetical protein
MSTIAKLDFKNENRSQLEKATFLSLAAGILYHGFSGFSSACRAAAQDKRGTGASCANARARGGKAQQLMNIKSATWR